MAFAITDLVTPATADEMLADLLEIAASFDLPTTSWQQGQPLHTLLKTVAQKLADYSIVAAEIAKGGFGDLLPSDSWADLWASSRFNVTRVEAEAATGYVDLSNTSVTQYDLAAGDLIVAHATTGKTYRNTEAISVLALVGLSDVEIAADEVGTDSNAAPGAITVLVSSLTGVTSTNPESVLGTDKETTAALVARARAKLAARSPLGPRDVYDYVATTPELSDVGVAITRTRTVADEETGLVTVYLATASGAAEAGDVAIVQAALDEWATPWCITATATAATEVTKAVTYQVWMSGSSLTSTQIKAAIDDAIATFFSTLPVGGYLIPPDTGALYLEALRQAIGRATPGIQQVSVTLPAADVSMTPDQVAVLGTITSTITIL
jgi:hypothetical protein